VDVLISAAFLCSGIAVNGKTTSRVRIGYDYDT